MSLLYQAYIARASKYNPSLLTLSDWSTFFCENHGRVIELNTDRQILYLRSSSAILHNLPVSSYQSVSSNSVIVVDIVSVVPEKDT